MRREFKDIVNQTVHRLRNFLHQGKLNAYYFDTYAPPFGTAEPLGDGKRRDGAHYDRSQVSVKLFGQLFLLQSELDALLIKQPAEKRPLPKAKIPELVAALRKLDDLPTARLSSKHCATCRNFASSRSRMPFFETLRNRPGCAALGANRADNRDEIRDEKFRPSQLTIF